MTSNWTKRCFTMIHCELHNSCNAAHMPHTNGYFTPEHVGEHCHHYSKLELSDEAWGKLPDRMGELE